MSEEFWVGICRKCAKYIRVKDKEFYAIPVEIKGEFSHNEFYHIDCYIKKAEGK